MARRFLREWTFSVLRSMARCLLPMFSVDCLIEFTGLAAVKEGTYARF